MKTAAILCLMMWAALVVYTGYVLLTEGAGFIPAFLKGLASLTWQGQFNLDFAILLVVLAAWVGWRFDATPRGVLFAALTLVLGATFLLPLLAYLATRPGATPGGVLTGASPRD